MKTGKHLAGAALFLFIFGSTVVINNLLRARVGTVPPVELKATTPVTILESTPEPTNYSVRMVSLDFINGKSYTTLRLKRETGQPALEKLWVRTVFFAPNTYEGWSTLGEIRRPFSHGDQVEITAKADCGWCKDSKAPKAGYFADVYVSTEYAADLRSQDEHASRNIMTAFPVLVQNERKSNPFATR